VASITWGREIAEVYDETYRAGFKPSLPGPVVDLLAGLAHDGPVLEFAAGAGRAALALHARGAFTHVYLAANTIMNVTSKDDQIAVFANAAAHLESGVLRGGGDRPAAAPGAPGRDRPMFTLDSPHVGIETFNDLVGTDRLVALLDPNRRVRHSPPYRYV
jgi:hypothetical protein